MSESEDQIHARYNKRMREITQRVRDNPDDWEEFLRGADEVEALDAQLTADLKALPQPKRKWWKR